LYAYDMMSGLMLTMMMKIMVSTLNDKLKMEAAESHHPHLTW